VSHVPAGPTALAGSQRDRSGGGGEEGQPRRRKSNDESALSRAAPSSPRSRELTAFQNHLNLEVSSESPSKESWTSHRPPRSVVSVVDLASLPSANEMVVDVERSSQSSSSALPHSQVLQVANERVVDVEPEIEVEPEDLDNVEDELVEVLFAPPKVRLSERAFKRT
jgi:hypothetical protein